LKFQPS
jgi:hypothetical protein